MLTIRRKRSSVGRSRGAVAAVTMPFAFVALLAACTANPDRMVVQPGEGASIAPNAWAGTLCLRNVVGGEQWNLMSQAGVVEDAALREALEKTLQQNGLAAPRDGCRFFLDVDILGISQPSHGLFVTSVQTDSHLNYKVYDPAQKPIFVDTVSASYTEPFSLLPAVARVQHAAEGAIRTNFEQFLKHLAAKQPAI
jgi:hypothetical protein